MFGPFDINWFENLPSWNFNLFEFMTNFIDKMFSLVSIMRGFLLSEVDLTYYFSNIPIIGGMIEDALPEDMITTLSFIKPYELIGGAMLATFFTLYLVKRIPLA